MPLQQELGGRLSRPTLWKDVYLLRFVYRMLDRVRIVQAIAQRVDFSNKTVTLRLPDGGEAAGYDGFRLHGCTNSFGGRRRRFGAAPTARDVGRGTGAGRCRADHSGGWRRASA